MRGHLFFVNSSSAKSRIFYNTYVNATATDTLATAEQMVKIAYMFLAFDTLHSVRES